MSSWVCAQETYTYTQRFGSFTGEFGLEEDEERVLNLIEQQDDEGLLALNKEFKNDCKEFQDIFEYCEQMILIHSYFMHTAQPRQAELAIDVIVKSKAHIDILLDGRELPPELFGYYFPFEEIEFKQSFPELKNVAYWNVNQAHSVNEDWIIKRQKTSDLELSQLSRIENALDSRWHKGFEPPRADQPEITMEDLNVDEYPQGAFLLTPYIKDEKLKKEYMDSFNITMTNMLWARTQDHLVSRLDGWWRVQSINGIVFKYAHGPSNTDELLQLMIQHNISHESKGRILTAVAEARTNSSP